MTQRTRWILAVLLSLVVAGCASAPTAPSVMALAGSGKSWDQFRADDGACRQAAGEEIARTKGGDVPLQTRYDIVYMQCMYAKGHQIPAAGGAPTRTSSPTTVPPGTPTVAPAGPPTPEQINCELNGGVWRAALNFCEIPRRR
jgi:hypothetical protein